MHDSSFSRNKQQTVSFTIILSHRKQQFFLLIPRVSWPVPRRKQTWGPTGCGRTGNSPCSNPPAPQSPPGYRKGRAGHPLLVSVKQTPIQTRGQNQISRGRENNFKLTLSHINFYSEILIIFNIHYTFSFEGRGVS